MRLIIDAGSTKMEWILMEGNAVKQRFTTAGFNPNYNEIQCLENIVDLVETRFIASSNGETSFSRRDKSVSLQTIYYYGTGCGNEQNCQTIKEVFQHHFHDVDIHVTHDLMAACHAVSGHEKGIVCILGTGSNSCLYDGENIIEKGVSLGCLVGDEGSGMQIGREVVRTYFYGFMPDDLRQKFDDKYHLELKDFIQRLYHEGQPSRYLATFAKFAVENQTHPYIRGLVKGCFKAFIEASILCYDACKSLKVSFIGSVAYLFLDLSKECLTEQGLTLGEVMQAPAEGLIEYYRNIGNKIQ